MYDDFPILSTQDYLNINNQYLKANTYALSTCLDSVVNHLQACKQLSFNPDEVVNPALARAINDARETVNLAMENLTLIFNVKAQTNNQVKDFDVFAFFNELIGAVDELNKISINEQKQYCKNMVQKTMGQLLISAQKVTSALMESKIKIFKYL